MSVETQIYFALMHPCNFFKECASTVISSNLLDMLLQVYSANVCGYRIPNAEKSYVLLHWGDIR